MKYEVKGNDLTLKVECTKARKGWRHAHIKIPNTLSEQNLHLLAAAAVNLSIGKAVSSQLSIAPSVMTPLFKFISLKAIDLPMSHNDSEWAIFLVNLYIFYLTDSEWSDSSVVSRIRSWRYVIQFFNELKDQRVLPIHVSVPKSIDKKQMVGFESKKQYVVGEPAADKSSMYNYLCANSGKTNKILLDLSYTKDNDKYLEDIESDLQSLIHKIDEICTDHWESMKVVHQKGKRIIHLIK